MVKTSIELIANNIGFDIANSDDRVQADLLNGLGRGFKIYLDQNKHTQVAYIVQHLTPEAKELLKLINDYIKD